MAHNISSRSFLRFVLVGGAATALHYGLTVLFIVWFGWQDVVASTVGFICSAVCNYALNARLTFEGNHRHGRALPRFAVTAASGCGINYLLLVMLARAGLPFVLSQLLATGVVLLWNYLLSALWTFRR